MVKQPTLAYCCCTPGTCVPVTWTTCRLSTTGVVFVNCLSLYTLEHYKNAPEGPLVIDAPRVTIIVPSNWGAYCAKVHANIKKNVPRALAATAGNIPACGWPTTSTAVVCAVVPPVVAPRPRYTGRFVFSISARSLGIGRGHIPLNVPPRRDSMQQSIPQAGTTVVVDLSGCCLHYLLQPWCVQGYHRSSVIASRTIYRRVRVRKILFISRPCLGAHQAERAPENGKQEARHHERS